MEFAFSEEQQELAATVRVAARQARRLRRGPGGDGLRERVRRGALADAVRADRGGRAGDPGGVRRRRVLAARVDDRAGGGRPLARARLPCCRRWSPPRPCSPADRRGASSGCCRGSPPARCAAFVVPGEPALFADQATVLVAATDDGLVELDPASSDVRWLPSMDQTIRLGVTRRRPAGPRSATAAAARPRAEPGGRGRRGRPLGRPVRPGARDDRRLLQGAGAVRPADRLLPGAQAPDGRHAGAGRDVPLGVVGGVVRPLDRRRRTPTQLAHVAKSYCSDALSKIAAETVQLHGGIAITWEHDAQLVFKRAHALASCSARPHMHRALIEPVTR